MSDGIDRTAVRISRLDQLDSDYEYWQTQPHRRRLSTVEEIRREYHRWQNDPPPADFSEFVAFLNEHDVRYLIVGGYAVAFIPPLRGSISRLTTSASCHGHPRYTKNIDIWIERTPENVGRVLAALEAFGFGSVGLGEIDFLKPGQVVELGRAPNQIDLFTDLKGVRFAETYENRVTDDYDGVALQFIGREALKRSKQAAGRLQDLADLENLGLS